MRIFEFMLLTAFSITADAAMIARYAGHYFDIETDLVYAQKRYYQPQIGQFNSPDPLIVSQPKSCFEMFRECDMYSYVQRNPVNRIDPTGLGSNPSKQKTSAKEQARRQREAQRRYREARRHQIQVSVQEERLDYTPAEGFMETGVSVSASGLAADEYISYEIRWNRGAVPAGEHLGQIPGQGGGWVVDRAADGETTVGLPRNQDDNPRYRSMANGAEEFSYFDQIVQPTSIIDPTASARDRQWQFRAVVRQMTGDTPSANDPVIIRSAPATIQWPSQR